MGSKILSKSGASLADVYDVKGSVAGIEELDSAQVQLTHDMASTIFSERMGSSIVLVSTGALLQSTTFDVEITGLPATPFRVHNIMCNNGGTTTVARLAHACVVMVSEPGARDIIIWAWDGTVQSQRIEGGTDEILGRSQAFGGVLPTIGMGGDQPSRVPQMFFRGETLAFGGSTVNIACVTHFSNSQLEGISSVGLPIPSW